MNIIVARFAREVDYLRAIARMYQSNGETEISRLALEAAQAIEHLIQSVIDEQAASLRVTQPPSLPLAG